MFTALKATKTLFFHIRHINIFQLRNLTLVQHALALFLLIFFHAFANCNSKSFTEIWMLILLCLEVKIDYCGILVGVMIFKPDFGGINDGDNKPSCKPKP
jgi:hypothetical protein